METKTIPLPIEHIPNEALSKRLLAPASEKGYQDYEDLDSLFADLKTNANRHAFKPV